MRHLIATGLALTLSGCAGSAGSAGSAPTSLVAFESAPGPPNVIIERDVQLKKVGRQERANVGTGERVFHITDYRTVAGTHVRSHDYWVMIGPHGAAASTGHVIYEARTDDQGNQYQAPAWQVIDGYARMFGWLPIATSDQVIAGGIGTSFVLQVDRSDPKGPVSRVFLVNTKSGDRVIVTDRTTGQSQTLVHNDGKYVERDNAAMSKKTLPVAASDPVRVFLDHVEARAAEIGQP